MVKVDGALRHASAGCLVEETKNCNVQESGMSSISSAQEPKSVDVSTHITGRKEVSRKLTLILQEGPNGHLLPFLLFRRCRQMSAIVFMNPLTWMEGGERHDSHGF